MKCNSQIVYALEDALLWLKELKDMTKYKDADLPVIRHIKVAINQAMGGV